jgi:type I restriction enzyme, S subunit
LINRRLTYADLSAKTFQVLERYEISDGDVFISIAGVNLGVAGVFRADSIARTILTENAAKLRIVTDDVPEYLCRQVNGPIVQRQILEEKGIGAGVPKLALFRIQQLLVPFPDRQEQLRIIRQLQVCDNLLRQKQDGLAKLRSLKTALMQDLLTGKKRVTALLETPKLMPAEVA